MITRIVSGIIMLPLLVGIVFLGDIYLKAAIIILSIIGLNEFYHAVFNKKNILQYISFIFSAFYCFFVNALVDSGMAGFLAAYVIAIITAAIVKHEQLNINDVCLAIFGFLYVPFSLSFVYLLRAGEYGMHVVWFIFICSFICDTFAYFTGVFFGKHKLIPALSPNKTIEGSIGGIFFTCLFSLIYGYIVSDELVMLISPSTFLIIGLFGSMFAQLGDLFASSVKRFTGIKDYGKLIPGHGGILDRFDSVLVTAPVVYIFVRLITYLSS